LIFDPAQTHTNSFSFFLYDPSSVKGITNS
jgi:hypothetical protein